MERVTFREAKILKGQGFCQDYNGSKWYDENGTLLSYRPSRGKSWAAPTYYEVWEWLTSKRVYIDVYSSLPNGLPMWTADPNLEDGKTYPGLTQEKALKECISYLITKEEYK